MARMPGVRWEGEHSPKRAMQRYDIVCVHTIVGQAPAHAAHFSTWADGRIYQSRDTRYQSGANLEGNHRVIAIENADMPPTWNTADGHAVPAMTAAQVEACARIAAWANQTHGIPLVANPNSRPTSRGIGYHRQGIDGNFGGYAYPGRVEGGESWTTSPGKVCPGDRRIKQTLEEIIPRAIAIAGGDDDMPVTDAEMNAIAAKAAFQVWQFKIKDPDDDATADPGAPASSHLRWANENAERALAILSDLPALAAELAPLIVAELPDPTTLTEQQMQNAVLTALTGSPLVPKLAPPV